MDTFAQLPSDEQEAYFREAAARLGLRVHVVEKDFWVCWCLKRVFSLELLANSLLFKGGTSLSKVHRLIRRFSEDIDVSIHRASLGYGGERDPADLSLGKNKRKDLLSGLKKAAGTHVTGTIQPALRDAITTALSAVPSARWNLGPDPTDPDGQSLQFTYPATRVTLAPTAYLRPSIKIEFGARSDHWPAEVMPLRPYLEEAIPGVLDQPEIQVKTMDAVRTFWEKATILHQIAHQRADKPLGKAYSRHYNDLAAMIQAGIGDQAKDQDDIRAAVVEHKSIFFRDTSASYDTAVRGTLKLVPDSNRIEELKTDLVLMSEMFFDEPPTLDDILDTLREWGDHYNHSAT